MATKPKAAKDEATQVVEKAAKSAKAETSAKKPGREASPETLEMRKSLKKLASRKSGVTNIELATELGITTLKASAIANQLLATGEIEAQKSENGRVTYFKAAKAEVAA